MRKTPSVILFLLVLAAGSAFGQLSTIRNSQHDLSTSSTSSVKSQGTASGGTDEVCVFCHTPHKSSTSAQLWNRTITAASYTLYTSDYLTSLGYLTASPAVQPGAMSKLCLSCHDGTIALGSVYNLPGPGGYSATPGAGIPMQSAGVPIVGGAMPTTVDGYLGTNLTNDHPVGYIYNAQIDTELVASRNWPWGNITLPSGKRNTTTGVSLYPDTGNNVTHVSTGTLECPTCHNAHNNQYYNFLRMDNTNAALCTYCHNKATTATSPAVVYSASAHQAGNATTQSYTPLRSTTGTNTATTVAEWSCRGCHKMHGPTTSEGLQNLQLEENSCYEKGCHGTNTTYTDPATPATPGFRLIQPDMSDVNAHPSNAVSGAHKNRMRDATLGVSVETQAELGSPNRHAECPDCHNPHKVPPNPVVAKSTRGTLGISAALAGTWGVNPTFVAPAAVTSNATNFAAPTAYTKVSGASLTYEYQVCLKCHSDYVTLPAGARNIAQEINPYNSSYHGIVPLIAPVQVPSAANLQVNYATNFFVNQNTMAQPWAGNAAYTAAQAEACRINPATCAAFAASRGRVWCSDCHNSDLSPAYPSTTVSATVPSGPHGSSINGIIPAVMAAKIPPAPVGSTNSDAMLIATLVPGAQGTPLCLECHGKGTVATEYLSTNANSRMTRHAADGIIGRSPQGCLSCHMWNTPSANIGGDGLIYPHGLNRRWYTNGNLAAGSGSGQMVDAFNGGWYTNMDYTTAAKKCWTNTTNNVAPSGVTPCNSHNGVGY